MAIASFPKAASKFISIAAPSIQALLRPSTQFFQSPAVDPRFFNLPQPETARTADSPGVHLNLREIGLAKNWSLPLGYSAARKPAPKDDDFSDEDEDDEEGDALDFEDEAFGEDDDEDFSEEDEEEIEKPKNSKK